MPRSDGYKNLILWKPGQSGNPAGPKPKLINKLAQDIGVELGTRLTKDELGELLHWALELPPADLKDLVESRDCPMFLCNLVYALVKDAKMGKLDAVNMVLDRVFGRPKNEVDVNNKQPINIIITQDESEL